MLESKQSIEHQRRLNPPIQEVVKKEIIKWLDAWIVYPIVNSSCVCPVQYVPKKGGINVVPNEKNELVPMRPVAGWRICMYYHYLNAWTKKDHFPMLFMDQMLDRLAGKGWYCFLYGYLGYNQISIARKTKRRPLSLVLMELFLSKGYHLGCAMRHWLFNVTWCQYFMIWWRTQLRNLLTISL